MPIPHLCEDCPPKDRRYFGCGVSSGIPWINGKGPGYKGQSSVVYSRDEAYKSIEKAEFFERTCPQYFRRSPFVLRILEDLDDYEAGRLGPLHYLPASYLFYLRLASIERKSWQKWWEEELMP